jgi:hypothetical protein
MPWLIGIDEAGYGPNLGPLVMTSVACRVPEDLAGADLWRVLVDAVRRPAEPDDGRLLVEDSKVVYSTARGLHALETGVLAALPPGPAGPDLSLARYLDWLAPAAAAELACECWYHGRSPLPVAAEPAGCGTAAGRFADASRRGRVVWGPVRSAIICPARFNGVLDRWGSKGAVLGEGLTELLRWNRDALDSDEALSFLIDKHGGRNTYAPMLQEALPDGVVIAQRESMARSTYTVIGTGRDVRLTFQPRADAEHFCVALASMVSKYLREVLMLEFNRFWQEQVPGLKPTAGYPGDAARFLEAIRPALGRLGLAESAVWRRK